MINKFRQFWKNQLKERLFSLYATDVKEHVIYRFKNLTEDEYHIKYDELRRNPMVRSITVQKPDGYVETYRWTH